MADKTVKSRGNDDENKTVKGSRGRGDDNSTVKGKLGKNNASDGGEDRLRPYEQQKDDSLRRRLQTEEQKGKAEEWPGEFDLDGQKYKNEGILSDSSGEAIIFLVSRGGKKYALKIYYYDPEHRPNHEVLEKIRKLGGSGLLVNIVSHGQWSNPGRPGGEQNDYELMDYCEGGSLEGVTLAGDEKALTEVAVRIASAIDFLSKHGILHRDIKPGNFFYADKAKTKIVLADFGLSVECPEGKSVRISEMRTPAYAAPEFYANVPGELPEVGVESDYYSLGVALLSLWIGKEKLTANESQLLRSKLNETLPMPKNMSAHTVSLLKALTRVKMNERATFDDIKRWVNGEDLDNDAEAGAAKTDFHVVFNSAKNQVANSPAELARLLTGDPTLGKKYLYSGRVTRWLEEAGHNETAVNVEEIVEEIYPEDQEAGLWSVAYMLDPSMEYVAPDGTSLKDPAEISIHITNNHYTMAKEVEDPDSKLMIYLRASGLKSVADLVLDYVDNVPEQVDETVKGVIATYYLAVLLNPGVPLRMYSSAGEGETVFVDTIDEVLEVLHNNGNEFGYTNWWMLLSPAFVVWLSRRNPALAGKIRLLQDNPSDDPKSVNYNSNSAYRIAYELNPEADFYFNTDTKAPDRCYTIREVGAYMEERLGNIVSGETDLENEMGFILNFPNTRVADYLRSRGKHYMTFLEWMEFCVDCDNDDNKSKPGPYDIVIGFYKGIAGFLDRAPYYPLAGKKLKNPDDLAGIGREEIRKAIDGQNRTFVHGEKPQPWLDAWLTLFYQEDPKLDLKEKFTYEKATSRYMDKLCELAPGGYYQNRYSYAMDEVNESAKKIKESGKNFKRNVWIYLLLSWVPGLIVIGGILLFGLPEENPIKGHIIPTLLILFAGFAIYRFLDSYYLGEFMFDAWGDLPGAAGWSIAVTIFLYAGFAMFQNVLGLIIIGLLALLLLKGTYSIVKECKVDTGGVKVTGDEFEYKQLDALYYTFRQTGKTVENVLTKYAELQGDNDRHTRSSMFGAGTGLAARMWLFFVLWYLVTPQVSGETSWVTENQIIENKKGAWVLGRWEAKYKGGQTRVVCDIDSVEEGKYLYGTMTIAGQAPVKAKGRVNSENDTIPDSFSVWPEENGEAFKQCLMGEYRKRSNTMSGHYYDRKEVMHEVEFLSSPLPGVGEPSKAQAPTRKTNRKAKPNTPAETETTSTTEGDGNILGEDTMQ